MVSGVLGFSRSLLGFANTITGIVAAILLVVFYLVPSMLGTWDDSGTRVLVRVRESAAFDIMFFYCLGLLLVNGLWWGYGRRPDALVRCVASETASGRVMVLREVIESGLRAAGEAVEKVTRVKVSVSRDRMKSLVIRAQFQAPEGVAIPVLSSALRERLDARFRELVTLTESDQANFEIEFVGFAGKFIPEKDGADELAENGVPMFTGPRYPIGDEG